MTNVIQKFTAIRILSNTLLTKVIKGNIVEYRCYKRIYNSKGHTPQYESTMSYEGQLWGRVGTEKNIKPSTYKNPIYQHSTPEQIKTKNILNAYTMLKKTFSDAEDAKEINGMLIKTFSFNLETILLHV